VPGVQVALSTARKRNWAASGARLSSADLAMHVVLPEWTGASLPGVTSFKSPGKRDPDLQFSRFAHPADSARIEAVADRVTGWHRLAIHNRRHARSWRWCFRPIPDAGPDGARGGASMRWRRPKRSCPIWPADGYAISEACRSRWNCRRER